MYPLVGVGVGWCRLTLVVEHGPTCTMGVGVAQHSRAGYACSAADHKQVSSIHSELK